MSAPRQILVHVACLTIAVLGGHAGRARFYLAGIRRAITGGGAK